MIQRIHVKNLALIGDVSVGLHPGLNILTGETGAGKSVFIHSVYLLLGAKAGREYIRTGADHAFAEAEIAPVRVRTKALLEEADLPSDDDVLILSRRIGEGKSTARINGEVVTAGELRKVASSCMVLHGQQEQRQLLEEKHHRELLDDYAMPEIEDDLAAVADCYEEYVIAKKRFEENGLSDQDLLRRRDLLSYEYSELSGASLKEGEDEELEGTYRLMQHSRRIKEALSEVADIIDNEQGVDRLLDRAFRSLSDALDLDPTLSEVSEELSMAAESLSDVRRACRSRLEDLSFSEEEIRYTEERLNTLNHLKQKYRTDLPGLMLLTSRKEAELAELDDIEAFRETLRGNYEKALAVYNEAALRLSEKRKTAALSFEEKVMEELKDLNFLKSDFSVDIGEETEPGPFGTDKVSFSISMNPGEERKPLDLIASGGELSRIMLAVKTVLSDVDGAETLVFDEIDTGISGVTAAKVAQKLKKLSEKRQVICITHLPQIAALGDAHYHIDKRVEGGRTETFVSELDEGQITEELARMLGGDMITPALMETAAQMRNLNR